MERWTTRQQASQQIHTNRRFHPQNDDPAGFETRMVGSSVIGSPHLACLLQLPVAHRIHAGAGRLACIAARAMNDERRETGTLHGIVDHATSFQNLGNSSRCSSESTWIVTLRP